MALPDRTAWNGAAVLCMVVWATNFPVGVEILKTWNPLLFTPVRLGIAGLAVAFAALAMGQARVTARLCRDRRILLPAVAFSSSSLFFVWGQAHTDPVTASVIVSAMPLFSALIGWAGGRERLSMALVLALVLAVAGGILVNLAGPGAATEGSLLGALAMLAATLCYVLYSRMLVDDFVEAPVVAKTAASTLVGAALAAAFVALAAALQLFEPVYDLSPRTLGLSLWIGLAVGVSAILWFWVGGRIGVTVAAMHNNLVPFYVMLMAVWLGAVMTLAHVIGALLVVLGAAIAQWPAAGARPLNPSPPTGKRDNTDAVGGPPLLRG